MKTYYMKKILFAALLLLAFLQPNNLIAQELLMGTDLTSIKVDNLTAADITKIKGQLQRNNLTIDQVQPIVLSKGMSIIEFDKLKARLAVQISSRDTIVPSSRTQEPVVNDKTKNPAKGLVFGAQLFDNPTLNFEPNLKLATPLNYVLGPGDELQVSIFGVQEYNATIPVSAEGKVAIQYIGEIAVGGITIEAATQKIKGAIARIYSTVAAGQSKVSISLSRIRTIRVTIIGSTQPGNYSVSSLASVYNALFLGGGPSENGSYRNIELIRNNKVFTYIDIYKFLVNGNQSDNVGLKDNDVIRIPAYSQRVTLEGEVGRPGIFEMKAGETFADLLSFAAGFSDQAYTASVKVIQKTGKEFRIKDMKAGEFKTYQPLPGDVFQVAQILNRFENRIKIEGAVFRPGIFSFYEGIRIADLLAQADGLKEDAYNKRAIIVRLKADLTTEVVNVDLSKALAGDREANIALNKEDQVTIYSILDFKEDFKVTINGEIKNAGDYTFYDNLTLNDLLLQAGGLLGSASKRVEIARMIKGEEIDEKNAYKAELFSLEINAANNEQAKNFVLQPFDVINIRKMAVYDKPEKITITGAVAYGGTFVLANKNEKLFDVINRAGGLTAMADLNGVKIKRPIKASQNEEVARVNLKVGKTDTTQNGLSQKLKTEVKYAVLPVDWNRIVKDPKHNTNITLLAGDEVEIAVRTETVKITGNVLLTSEIPFTKGKGFNYYISAVGGLDHKAWRKRAYIIYPNGKAAVARNFLFFKSYPKVTPGSQIVVPERPESKRASLNEILSIASVVVGMSGVVMAILKR